VTDWLEMYRPGLGEMCSNPAVGGTIDFIGVGSASPGEKDQLIGFEMKTRTTNRTETKEKDRRDTLFLLRGQSLHNDCLDAQCDNASLRYCRIKCTDPEFSDYITSSHEAIQCLHHAYLYDINFVCLVIGDRNGNLEAGIFVEFTKELKESYGRKVLQDLYNFGLEWVYKSDIDSDDWPENEIKASLHRLDSPMSYESFERPYGVSNHASKIRCSCPFLVLPGYIRFLSPLGMLQNLGVIH
jgi:hypothetical protein